jgi:hypothetical protein
MKKNLAILVIGFIASITLAIGIGIGIRISQPKQEKPTAYHNECPMCHSEVKLMVRQYTCGNDYMIECLNDDCGMHTGYFDDKEELVEKWNKMFKTLSERKGEEK